LKFGIPLIPSELSAWIVDTSDRYIIGFFLGATFVGYYTPGYMLGRAIPLMLGGVFLIVLTPTLSVHYEKKNMAQIFSITSYCLKYILVISLIYIIGVMFFGLELLEILTNQAIAKNGYIIIIFTAITGLFYGIYAIFSRYVILKKNTKALGALWISASLINILGNIYLIPKIGILGAAITTVISYFFVLIGALYFAFKYFDIKIDYSYLPKLVISSVLTILFMYMIKYFLMEQIFINAALTLGFYFSLIWLFNIIKKEEILFIKKLIHYKK
jgi:O-antigen/teichoic acid export membrane protein